MSLHNSESPSYALESNIFQKQVRQKEVAIKKRSPLLYGNPRMFTNNNSNQPATSGTPGINNKNHKPEKNQSKQVSF